jgi:hypothetical protein
MYSHETQIRELVRYLKHETIYCRLYKHCSAMQSEEADSTSYDFDSRAWKKRHFIRLPGILVSRSTVYLVLHLMDQMNKKPYKKLLNQLGMSPTSQDDMMLDRTTKGKFSPSEAGIVLDRWIAQQSIGGRRTRQKWEILDREISSFFFRREDETCTE